MSQTKEELKAFIIKTVIEDYRNNGDIRRVITDDADVVECVQYTPEIEDKIKAMLRTEEGET